MTKSQQYEENGLKTQGAEPQGPVGFALTLKTVFLAQSILASHN